jgi:serine/threonine protein kinase
MAETKAEDAVIKTEIPQDGEDITIPEATFATTRPEGTFAERYHQMGEIARGAYGVVFTANPKSDPDKIYAVKVVDKLKMKKQKDIDAVFREAGFLQELRSLPNVIPIIDFIPEEQNLYVVLGYAKGGDLFRRLTEKRKFTEKDARDIAVVLFETLDVMHMKHSIVHRDLKPENLLLESKRGERIYLADFGFANKVPEHGLKTRCGTPAFVAPEILLGRAYHQPVDMWSIGCILFFMLGGCKYK